MKMFPKTILLFVFLSIQSFSQNSTPYLYHNNTNNWSGTGISGTYRSLGEPNWIFTFQAGSTMDNYYKFYNQSTNSDGGDFNSPGGSNVWSSGLTVNNNSRGTVFDYGDGNGSAGFFSITSGKYYTIIFKDVNTSSNSDAFVLETSNQPVTITSVSNNFSTRGTGNNGTVTITISTAKSTEEKIFVRYTTDGWTTSNFVEASGSGTSYTAIIPDAVLTAYNGNDEFYVLTTTIASPTHADADMMTINLNNNSGSNYQLPVQLTNFVARGKGKTIELKWNTATETNNAGFEIERKQHAQWTKVAFLDGHGTSSTPHEYSYSEKWLLPGKYLYRLKQIDRDGKFEYSQQSEATVGLSEDDFALSQNYPNPFNPSTTFTYAVKERQHVEIKVFNLIGQEVAVLVKGSIEPNRLHTVQFDGSTLSSGVYFYSLRTPNRNEIRKLMLMK